MIVAITKIKIIPMKKRFSFKPTRSFIMIKHKARTIKIIKKIKNVKSEKRFKSRLGSFLMFIILKILDPFCFLYSSSVPLLPLCLVRALEIKKIIKKRNNEIKIIMPNEIKFEI